MRGLLRFTIRYFCARCAYDLIRAALRRRAPKPAAKPCNHVSGVLLTIFSLPFLLLAAFGLLGFFLTH
jgi:hypothetical protein